MNRIAGMVRRGGWRAAWLMAFLAAGTVIASPAMAQVPPPIPVAPSGTLSYGFDGAVFRALKTDNTGALQIGALGGTSDATVAVSLTAVSQTDSLTLAGLESAALYVSSVGTGGQMVLEISNDNTNWTTVMFVPVAGAAQAAGTAITATGWYAIYNLGGARYVRVRCTAITGGTITGTMTATSMQAHTVFPQGITAVGSPVVGLPLLFGGRDTSGNVQYIQTDTSGRPNMVLAPSGSPDLGATTDTAPVSHDHAGSAIAHLRDIAIELGNVTGSIGAGTAGASAFAVGAVYSNVTPAPTNGQQVGLQVDSTGRLAVTQSPPWATPEQYFNVSITDNAVHTVFAAQAGLNGGLAQRHWITNILVVNHSTSVATKVEILDGATPIWGGGAGINDGGWSFTGAPGPLRQPTTDQALSVQCLTSGADVTVSVQGYYAP